MDFSNVDQNIIMKLQGQVIKPYLGGDPEFFIADKSGTILAADNFFPGKEDPITVSSRHGDYPSKLFFDGIQAEMAVSHNRCREYFADNIFGCWQRSFANNIPKDHNVVIRPSIKVSKSVIENAHPEARIFGCMPDYNAYTCTTNTPEMDASTHMYRYAGGHMHFGCSSPYLNENHEEYKIARTEEGHLRAVKFLDLIMALPTVLLDSSPGAKRRRAKYGKAGCFRPTPYGIEYRTPSCWWLRSPMTVSLAYGLGRLAWVMMCRGMDQEIRKAIGFPEEDVRGAIDESDKKTVLKIWDALRPYVALSSARFSNPLHIASALSGEGGRVMYPSEEFTGMAGRLPKLSQNPVFALAVFEYVLENGLDVLVGEDIRDNWSVGSVFSNTIGWVKGSYHKFRNDSDFLKFQSSFLRVMFPKTKVPYVTKYEEGA